MAQIILLVIAFVAFIQKSIPVTKLTEIRRPKSFILGGYALVLAFLAGSISNLLFYLLLIFFFVLVGILSEKKYREEKQ